MYEIKGRGITKIVSSNQVEQLTREGYELVGMYQEMVGTAVSCESPDPDSRYNTMAVEKPGVSSCAYFIMRLDEESSMGELGKTIAEQKVRIEELDKTDQYQKKGIEKLEKSLKSQREEAESYKKNYDQNSKELIELRDLKRKMETDIGKIEKALGTQRMKEILAEEK